MVEFLIVKGLLLKKQRYQLLNTNREFFPILMPPTFINCLMNLSKLDDIYKCAKAQ